MNVAIDWQLALKLGLAVLAAGGWSEVAVQRGDRTVTIETFGAMAANYHTALIKCQESH